jgi:hypothetical protein
MSVITIEEIDELSNILMGTVITCDWAATIPHLVTSC